mmetsp:Transcript_30871/g.91657  ORF Transcript_30871/g.91657 Transcript_30871/m.91657 type:complete len:207 (+) Transcript_30871:1174-1794(+)
MPAAGNAGDDCRCSCHGANCGRAGGPVARADGRRAGVPPAGAHQAHDAGHRAAGPGGEGKDGGGAQAYQGHAARGVPGVLRPHLRRLRPREAGHAEIQRGGCLDGVGRQEDRNPRGLRQPLRPDERRPGRGPGKERRVQVDGKVPADPVGGAEPAGQPTHADGQEGCRHVAGGLPGEVSRRVPVRGKRPIRDGPRGAQRAHVLWCL